MCGIVGYVGKSGASSVIMDCLRRLEYRGYDSAGLSILNSNLQTYKTAGSIGELYKVLPAEIEGNIGIGHTRWATHGIPNDINAHPHCSSDIVVVHNGIIENYLKLQEWLEDEGYEFVSDTDTEVIAHLVHFYSNSLDLFEAVRKSMTVLEGSYAIAVMSKNDPDTLIAARKDSPLIVGLGENEFFTSSDATAFVAHTRNVVFVDDREIVKLTPEKVDFYDMEGQLLEKQVSTIDWDVEMAEKSGYAHFMLKEIHEQTRCLQKTFAGKLSELEGNVQLPELNLTDDQIRNIGRVEIIACGTSWNAGLFGKYLLEGLACIHTGVSAASEFRYRDPVMDCNTLTIAITQSGETADTLAAIRNVAQYESSTIAITNVVGSTITREAENVVYTHAGPEIGVAATKTFTAQLIALYLLAVHLGRRRNYLLPDEAKAIIKNLKELPGNVQQVLNQRDIIRKYAARYAANRDYYFIGRGLNYPAALEAALKLKEISYIHAEGYAAGELKHGPLALLENGTPVVAIVTKGRTYEKMLSNIKEVKARGAEVIAVADAGDREIGKYADIVIPVPATNPLLSPVLSSVALQLLAYYTALEKGCEIDKPRNLAKSVTVE
ncbi:glutamine--fructose-6-phosphate transaminase (isomerizing) [Methanohalophilus sp.]